MKPGQLIKYIKPDGTEINLHSPPSRAVANMTGWGYLPPNTHTVQGPFEHGNTLVGYRLPTRTISLDVIKRGCSRSEWFNERTNLIQRLGIQSANPNLPEVGRLQWEYVEDSTIKQRAVDCYLKTGLEYPSDPQWWQYGILTPLEFEANNPFIYDPTRNTTTIDTWTEALILPMTFPFLLGAGYATSVITYAGDWPAYPTIEVDGPTAGVYIENTTLEKFLSFSYVIPTGDTVTFDTYSKIIYDNNGNNLIGYLSNDSDLTAFTLERDPHAPGGANTMYVIVTDTDATTEVRISYYTQFTGI